jgi:hypothetical protein
MAIDHCKYMTKLKVLTLCVNIHNIKNTSVLLKVLTLCVSIHNADRIGAVEGTDTLCQGFTM